MSGGKVPRERGGITSGKPAARGPDGAAHSSTRPILTSSELEPLYVTELLTGRVVALRLEGAEASSRAVPRAARKHAR
jgi:hypothetical protein